MKSIEKLTRTLATLALVMSMAILFSSCQKDPVTAEENAGSSTLLSQIPAEEDNGETKMNQELLQSQREEMVDFLNGLRVNLDMLEEETVMRPGGKTDHVFTVGGDIEISRETLSKLRNEPPSRQYSTDYLVSSPRTISVGIEQGSFGHVPVPFHTGISWAIDNYNNLGIGLDFTLTTVNSDLPNAPAVDILIYLVDNNTAGGKAGFSDNSDPYPYIQIYTGMFQYMNNNNMVEHLITHEIGHCIGLRHTDWQTRGSCSNSFAETTGWMGANHIPGTPTGSQSSSIMQACFSTSAKGEFSGYDKIALEYLY